MPDDPAVDLRSDTVTHPTPAMREAMHGAPLGDDVLGDDPTVHALQDKIAAMLGKQAALFVPSGTMANLLAVRCLCEPGDDIIIHEGGHIINYETSAFAAIAGCSARPIPSPDGRFDADDLSSRIRPRNCHFARSRLLVVENTSNTGGGTIWPRDQVQRVCERAREHDLACHLDGARLFNACVASGTSPADYAKPFDTVSTCFSKGLGAPVGSALAGSKETIERAHRFRKMLGGAMRQAGLLAAAAIHALDNHIDRLSDDHANARALAQAIHEIPGLTVDLARVQTNIVYFNTKPGEAPTLQTRLESLGVRMLALSKDEMRAVTHLDVDRDGIDRAIHALRGSNGTSAR